MDKPVCPACGHDELELSPWRRTHTPRGGAPIEYEVMMFACPACTESFEAPGASEIVKAVYEAGSKKDSV